MNVILSLDISSVSTGWSVYTDNSLTAYGVIKLKSKTKHHGEKLLQLENSIVELVNKYRPTIFSFEDIWKGPSIKTYKILALYHGIAYKACFVHFRQDPIVLMPSNLRKILAAKTTLVLSGKKEQDKKDVFAFMKTRYGLSDFEFEKHNDITDAMAVGLATYLLLEEHNGSIQSIRDSTRVVKRRDKKGVQKTGVEVPSRPKSRKRRGRGKVQADQSSIPNAD
jgi:Holliday junction resolvasome RuvABC endonuclease subunit